MIADRDIPARSLRASLVSSVGEWLFALFLLAGYFKAEPRLAFVQTHVDITLLFLILSFLVFLSRGLRNAFTQKIPLSFIRVAALFLLLATCLIGGLLHTESRQYGFDKAIRFIFLTGWAFFGGALLISDLQSLRRFSWVLTTIATAMAIDAISGYPGVGQVGFVSAFGSNYIALARASGLGLLATVIFLLPTEQRSLVRFGLWIMASLQLWAILSAGARGPVLIFIFSLLLFFVVSLRGFPHLRIDRFALRLGILSLFAVVFLAVAGRELFPTLALRSKILITEVGTSAATRLSLYGSAVDQWASSPIWGGGTGEFSVAVMSEDIRLYPHNIILELAAETGLIGVLVFVTMIGMVLGEGFVRLQSEKGLVKIVDRYLLAACCFALLNAMVSGDINDNRMLFTLVGLLAVATRFRKGAVQ